MEWGILLQAISGEQKVERISHLTWIWTCLINWSVVVGLTLKSCVQSWHNLQRTSGDKIMRQFCIMFCMNKCQHYEEMSTSTCWDCNSKQSQLNLHLDISIFLNILSFSSNFKFLSFEKIKFLKTVGGQNWLWTNISLIQPFHRTSYLLPSNSIQLHPWQI